MHVNANLTRFMDAFFRKAKALNQSIDTFQKLFLKEACNNITRVTSRSSIAMMSTNGQILACMVSAIHILQLFGNPKSFIVECSIQITHAKSKVFMDPNCEAVFIAHHERGHWYCGRHEAP